MARGPLQGLLYFLSLVSAVTIALIGTSLSVYGPVAGQIIFGINDPKSNLGVENKPGDAYCSVIGVRDITLGFLCLCFTLLRDGRGVGLVLAGGIVATVGDALVMMQYSEDPFFFIGSHLVTGIPMFIMCFVLLAGGGQSSSKLKQ